MCLLTNAGPAGNHADVCLLLLGDRSLGLSAVGQVCAGIILSPCTQPSFDLQESSEQIKNKKAKGTAEPNVAQARPVNHLVLKSAPASFGRAAQLCVKWVCQI